MVNLDSSVDRHKIMTTCFNIERYSMLDIYLLFKSAYSFDCTFFRLICLTAKALHRMTMRGLLVGATESEKHTLKRVQLRILG
jgi:hypothetical protein